MAVVKTLGRLVGGALLATGGWRLGEYISATWGPEYYVHWVFGLATFGGLLGIAATPYVGSRLAGVLASQAEGVPTSRLSSGVAGVAIGLLLALLLAIPVARLPGWFGIALPAALSMLFAYLGGAFMLSPRRDLFQGFFPHGSTGVSINGSSPASPRILLDTSAIIDGRIADISHTGFVLGCLVVPNFVLNELQRVADSSDGLRRNRGRRGLEVLNRLRDGGGVEIEIMEVEDADGQQVDSRLVELAKSLNASIITTDFNLNRVAQFHGVTVLNINELATSLRPAFLPGEVSTVTVLQDGREEGQGVGFLDDGTMMVVEGGAEYKGSDLEVVITRVLQTSSGCIVFARPRRA